MVKKMIKQVIKQFVIFFKGAVFPPKCLSCKKIFKFSGASHQESNLFEVLMKPHLCNTCRVKFTQVNSPICTCCGMMFKERVSENHLCGKCLKKRLPMRVVRSFGIYDQALLDIIRYYKFKNRLQLAKPLGILLYNLYQKTYWDSVQKEWTPNTPDLIIPVPLHKTRFRKRTYNQSWLMIKNWDHSKINHNILYRKKATKPQTGLDKKKREKNIQGAFSISHTDKIKDKKILIIDDVYTTGSTVSECTKELLKNGARHVDVLTIARTQVV